MLFWRGRTPGVLLGVLSLALIAGCTVPLAPTSALPTASSAATTAATPTPTMAPTAAPTWSAEQAAAVKSVDDFIGTSLKILADPSKFTPDQTSKLLSASSGGDALTASVESFDTMRKKGFRVLGSLEMLRKTPTDPVDDGRGREVHVTVCLDQSSLRAVDRDGNAVSDARYQYPSYLLRQFSVRRPVSAAAFKVFGFQTINGACP